MRSVMLWLVVFGAVGCGGLRPYSPRCEERYRTCTDACAARCEPHGPVDDSRLDMTGFRGNSPTESACSSCVVECRDAADRCQEQVPVQDESPFRAPPEGDPPVETPALP
ncbi:MAG: hypothetical protein R3F65_27640 [bacterium]